eukprot:TRINITY_DN11504_c0_g2_i4.p1 TRINITY_DN11504_c0_g2~~TRINITY_DN11504_c0_g2_i4.p1  ORF type:complete len:160 (+),score=8.79 TRINITY_DN11504_c0_g2_i4:148-627(+)
MSCQDGEEFNHVTQYPYTVACSPSCHDTTTLRAWWEEDLERAQRYHKFILKNKPYRTVSTATPELVKDILQQHLWSPAMWVIFPIQDILALRKYYATKSPKDETINDPGNAKHYWRYRVHVNLETLCEDQEWKDELKELLLVSGRSWIQNNGIKVKTFR